MLPDIRLRGVPPTDLSPREWEVLYLCALMSQQAAADRMGISLKTAKNHIRHARLRRGHRTHRALLVDLGWLVPKPPPHYPEAAS